MICALAILSGCTLVPLSRFEPVVAPPNSPCDAKEQFSFLTSEPLEVRSQLHYVLPSSAPTPTTTSFESYYSTTKSLVQAKLPPGLRDHKVTSAFFDFLTTAIGEAQLDAQITDHTVLANDRAVGVERQSILKHRGPSKLSHREMKDFADKLFDLQLKPGAAALSGYPADTSGLSARQIQILNAHSPLDQTFIKYFEAYYHGTFVDRMGRTTEKPQISLTVPDSEIAAAETVLLEFMIDTFDPTPVMGDADEGAINGSTNFYPGGSTAEPTAHKFGGARYVKIPPGAPNACGITTQNAWVLRDLSNGASSQAEAVGGLVANTWGGFSFGLGVLPKVSVGDNQTLSVMVKTAAARAASRATLMASYWTLRHVKFNISEP
jgi:hypothetical protein